MDSARWFEPSGGDGRERAPTVDLADWFSVPGDMDDFIFYDEPPFCSDR